MEKIIVYVDDADYALRQIAPMNASKGSLTGREPTHWILVACAPRLTRRISKWVSHSARENWRAKWAEKLMEHVAPPLKSHGDSVTLVLATYPLPDLTRKLSQEHGTSRVLDARRPKFGQEMPPVSPNQPEGQHDGWQVPGAVVGMSAVLILAAD
ncbi:MAG TPA: hypothetical protein VLJ58_12390 [Ramlibacter sp.]|nr:hypothetical protein [Ramlibacter sp.]